MESFPCCYGSDCHGQLDQLLGEEEYDLLPLTPEQAPALEQTPVPEPVPALEQTPASEQAPAATEQSILPLPKSELLFAPPQL